MKNVALKTHSGMTLLIVVLIISAVAILLATTAGLTGIDALQVGIRQDATLEAFAGADGCMEVALKKLHDDNGYIGETVTLSGTTCVITVTGSGSTRTVKARASYSSAAYIREIQANVDWTTKFQIMSWQENTN